jgi:hypothetical protein
LTGTRNPLMIRGMEGDTHDRVDQAERLYEAGDYKQARALADGLLDAEWLEAGERDRLKRILSATRTDVGVVIAMAFTFCVLVFLVLKYAL